MSFKGAVAVKATAVRALSAQVRRVLPQSFRQTASIASSFEFALLPKASLSKLSAKEKERQGERVKAISCSGILCVARVAAKIAKKGKYKQMKATVGYTWQLNTLLPI